MLLISAHLDFACKTSRVMWVFLILWKVLKKQTNKQTWCLIHQNHQWNAGRSEGQTHCLSVLQCCGIQAHFGSIRRLDFGKLCPKNPASSWCWPKALRVKSKTSPGFGTNSLSLIKSGFVEYSLSMLLFLSLFHPCKPYWFLQLLVVWPQELNNGLQLLQHLLLPKFQILYLLNS